MPLTNVYCDESAHLEHDGQQIMGLGALWCPHEKTHAIALRLREIKVKHGLPASFEIKWVKVGIQKIGFYLDIVDYFFDDDDLHFRAVIADKVGLNHAAFNQDHDTWYYKMYFLLLGNIIGPGTGFRIYLDIKDTRSQTKVEKLHDVLCNSMYDFDRKIIQRIQQVRSHEIEQMQLADLLLGCVRYANLGFETSPAKMRIVNRVKERSHYGLTRNTLLSEPKLNLFRWSPQERGQ